MHNQAMKRKLDAGEAIDVSKYPRAPNGDYELPADIDVDGIDLCNAETEAWIWSVGKRHVDGKVFASESAHLYQNPEYDCLWLR